MASVPTVDTSRVYHSIQVHQETFHIDVRYSKLQYIASGAYGFVCAAEDAVTSRKVAIKKIRDVFRNSQDAKRILRELKLLRHLGGHENIIWILDIMVSPNQRDFKDLYIVTDIMESDLGRILDSSQTLSDSHIKYFIYQSLRALKYIHSAHILHRDLKPQNILVNSSCELVICDFGLARSTASADDAALDELEEDSGANIAANLTVYVVTRWYRAPELLLGSDAYGPGVDIWSMGCILAEILGRRPIFRGANYKHQLQVIVEVLGTPTDAELSSVKRRSALDAIRALGDRPAVSFAKLYPHANPDAIDLLSKMLVFDPAKRITAVEALAHPYMSDYSYPDDEPTAPRMVDVAFEKKGKLSKAELQAHMIREQQFFHPSNPDGPVTSSRLSETATKNMVTSGLVPAVGPASSEAAGAGGDPEVLLSKTAEKDIELEAARKEAQRRAQEARGAAALANLGAKGVPVAASGADLDSSLASTMGDVSPTTMKFLEARFAQMETVLTQRLTEHMQRLMAPIEARLSSMEAWRKAVDEKRRT